MLFGPLPSTHSFVDFAQQVIEYRRFARAKMPAT